jgi:hypothetical protein
VGEALNKQKWHFFSSSFFLTQSQRTGGWNTSCLGSRYQWEGGGDGEMYKYCVHMYVNGKIISVEAIPGMGWGR